MVGIHDHLQIILTQLSEFWWLGSKSTNTKTRELCIKSHIYNIDVNLIGSVTLFLILYIFFTKQPVCHFKCIIAKYVKWFAKNV